MRVRKLFLGAVPGGVAVKNPAANEGDTGEAEEPGRLVHGVAKEPGETELTERTHPLFLPTHDFARSPLRNKSQAAWVPYKTPILSERLF